MLGGMSVVERIVEAGGFATRAALVAATTRLEVDRALAAGDAEAGCSVHLVTDGVDEGPILGQARVPIVEGDTAASLSERVRTAEHALYPRVLADFCRRISFP